MRRARIDVESRSRAVGRVRRRGSGIGESPRRYRTSDGRRDAHSRPRLRLAPAPRSRFVFALALRPAARDRARRRTGDRVGLLRDGDRRARVPASSGSRTSGSCRGRRSARDRRRAAGRASVRRLPDRQRRVERDELVAGGRARSAPQSSRRTPSSSARSSWSRVHKLVDAIPQRLAGGERPRR